jgi:hypothetical protein
MMTKVNVELSIAGSGEQDYLSAAQINNLQQSLRREAHRVAETVLWIEDAVVEVETTYDIESTEGNTSSGDGIVRKKKEKQA